MDADTAPTLQSSGNQRTVDGGPGHDPATNAALSYHQERLWFVDRFETGHVYESSPTYHNIPLVLLLDGRVVHARLEQALNLVLDRHAVLRTNIVLRDEVAVQTIRRSSVLRLPAPERLDENTSWMTWAATSAARPFRLDTDLLIRAALLEIGDDASVLQLTLHHIVADRTSLRIIAEDLAGAYTALCRGDVPAAPPVSVEYSEYAEWQRDLTGEELEPLLFYWKWQLRPPLPVLRLPEARPRPAVHTYTAASHHFVIPEALALRMRELASKRGSSVTSALLAAFTALLHRYSSQDDIIVGVFAACRTQPGTEGLVGPLANLLPIRTRVSGDLSFASMWSQVANGYAAAVDHQELPFERLVLELHPDKDMSRTALFDVVFQCDEQVADVFDMGPLTARRADINLGWGKYDLNLAVHGEDDGFSATVVYNADIYDAPLAEQMMRHYVGLLEAVVEAPEQRIGDVPLLSPQELHEQVVTFNSSDAAYRVDATLHQLFEEQVARTPEHIALVFGDTRLTYAELDRRANRLAHYLRRRGAATETLVAVSLDRSADLPIALLAVLKAGAAYLPIDPDHPRERKQFIVDDAGARLLITTATLQEHGALDVSCVVRLDQDGDDIAACSDLPPANRTLPHHLAYCIYTSGSTGQPKGALVEHRHVVRLIANDKMPFAFSDADVWTLFHSAAFDFSVWEMHGALLYGGTLVVLSKEATRDPALFIPLLVDERVTVLNQTPSAFLSLAQALLQQNAPALSLRYVIFGGESLHPRDLRAWRDRYPAVRLINMYGITETTVHVTFKEITETDIETNVSNVGVPIPTTTVYVLDEQLRPVPTGVPGEIYVGGAGVCRGYLAREELTAARFIADPFRPGETLYRSGDLGRRLANGELIHLGRIDDQVQIRGFRVELGEIHRHIVGHPAVAQAEVVARHADAHQQDLIAYVVPSGSRNLSASMLRQHLTQHLPDYMIPAAFVFLPALPLTPNGKVDRRALPEPERTRPAEAEYAAPRTTTEDLMQGLWERTLARADIGVHDNFFELGGHSLLATQLFARIRDAFGVELPLRLLFEHPTIAGLSVHVDAAAHGAAMVAAPAIARIPRSGPLPLSFAQQRLWLLHELDPSDTAYNVPALFRVTGPLDVSALRRSIAEILRRHESLRTAFRVHDRAPVQVVWDTVADPVREVDLRGAPIDEAEARALAIAREDAWHPFDLGTAPLLRVTVIHLSDADRLLAVTVHHIVSDGWSMEVLVREVTTLYRQNLEGKQGHLPVLPSQYGDFAVWQREWLRGDVLNDLVRYWKDRLSGAPATIALPFDAPPALQHTVPAGTQAFSVDARTTARLREIARDCGATLFMTLLTAFAVLLHRYSGQEDLAIGTPIANRRRTETQSAIGFFVNTLVLRTDLSGRPTFRELLYRVRQIALDAYAHQDLPFEQVVEALHPDRSLSRTPLFQAMFSLQHAHRDQLELPNVTVTPLPLETRSAKFDLTMVLAESGPDLVGALEYNADCFSADTARRMVEHFQIVLAAVTADPLLPIAVVPLCHEDERRHLLRVWADEATDYPRDTTVHLAFEQQARTSPDAIALAFGDEELTYREVNERANQLAHFLQPLVAHRLGDSRLIGICMEQSTAQIVGLLAVLKIGCGYVPLDPDMPSERMATILDDAGVAAVLTQEHLLDQLASWTDGRAGQELPIVCVDREAETIATHRVENPPAPALPSDLAYVIYTSGSTGTPKGVAVTHRSILRLVHNTNYVQLVAADRVAQASNASFDAATFEVWGALLNGARLVGIDRQTLLSPPQFAAALRARGITVLFLTTALFNEIARQVPDAFGCLRCLLFGGEAVTPKWVRQVLHGGRPRHLLHVYGPTENTTFSTWYPIEEVPEGAATLPIGRGISNTQTYVLDDRFEPVPPGIAGELYLAGDGLAREYLRRPELTAAAFLPNPWTSDPGARVYRTGDIVRTRADGAIEFVGRRDQQVKIRGFRVEPGEIEAALEAHPRVRAATVVSQPDGDLNPLVAYVVPEIVGVNAPSIDGDLAETLLEALSDRLPAYMVPGAIVVLDAFPLNANGKVDRGRLPRPVRRTGTTRVAARTPTEELLCGLWSDVLDVSEVGANDDFYERGGHSLLATQLASRIRETFEIELPLWRLFESATPAALAPHVDAQRDAAAISGPQLGPAPTGVARPLSFAQERLWFLDQLVPGDPFYNVALAIRLTGRLDASALERSLQLIVRRHDALRTTFATVDGRPVQEVHDDRSVALTIIELAGMAHAEQEQEIQRLAAEEARRPFVLARGPLLRASLVVLAPDAHVLLLTMHHIVSDGWSLGVLLREASTVYSQITNGDSVSLPDLPLQYADFAYWQREWFQGDVLETQLAYWKRQLAGAPQLLRLPTDRPRPRRESFRGSSEETSVDSALADDLRRLGRRSGTTLFMTLLAAFAALLQRYSGQEDFVIGTPVANRTRRETEDLIGFFVNTLALRFDGSGNPTFAEVLARVRGIALGAYDHQDLPFERLVDELGAERDLSRNPLFQVMFALQNAPMRLPAVAGLQMASLSTKRVAAQFDLVLDVWETTDGLAMVWEYNADLFDGATILRMASHFHSILRAVAGRPELRIAELPLLSADEQRQLVALGRGPDLPYPSDRCLQDLFEAQVRTSPHRVAAVHGSDTVTYAALNEASNQIAHWLRRRGVGPNQFVAILEERGIDFFAAMLGALKAGAAFLPIDPRYPSDRIRYMLADSQVQTLITREAHCKLAFDAVDDFHLRSILTLDDRPLRARHGVADVDDRRGLQREARTDPPRTASSDDLAYMLYTSGSTGLPKGALVRHNGAVNHIFAQCQALKLHPDTAFLQSAPSSSDISVWQFLAPLLIGGRTVIADYETVCDPASLFATIRAQGVTLIELVPVVLQSLIDHVDGLGAAERTLPALQCAMVTGEIVQPSVVNRWFAQYPEIPLVNAYGPTEAADDICQAVLTGPLDPERSSVPIGRPLANLGLFVLDGSLNLVVPGALGEICVAGVGVGAGYWRRDAQTQASFVGNPFAVDTRDTVIYRTGDLGRWRPDGLLELSGRVDDQVKINGFRIELGEVETVLTQHPSVQQAAVVVQHDDVGEKRLVAHVVPARGSDWAEDRRHQAEQVATWEMLHDKDYGQAVETPDPTLNTIGWESTYTGLPIPDEEMREYVDRTLERILALRPRKVLEIGCGTGLLAFRLIPRCEEYWGTDLSAVAIARLTRLRGLLPPDKPVTLLHREAADLSGIPEDFDVIVINSVSQYFPTCAYLVQTLEQAIRRVRAGGAVFVGDVRDLRLQHAYHASVQTYKADATLPIRQLRRRVQRQIAQEQELLVHPDFFVALQQQCLRLSQVRIEAKRGRFNNELTRFRFDATLEVEAPRAPAALSAMESWRETQDLRAIRRRLGEDKPDALGYRAVPNARVQIDSYLSNQLRHETAFQVAGALAQAAAERAGIGLDPEELWDVARDLGYAVEIGCSAEDPTAFDVLFRREGAAPHADQPQPRLTFASRRSATPHDAWAGLTNHPLRETLTRGFTSELLGHLKSKLPKHMIPAQFVLTEALPLTPAGKVNRSALPAADLVAASPHGAGDPPRTDVEKALVEIWREVLGIEDIGVSDNFFDLGGHSLKATQVVSRIAGRLDVEIPLRELFNHPTIAELAAAVEAHAVVRYRPIERVPDADHYPVSHAQRRLWVLAEFDAASRAYNMPAALQFDGPLDRDAFERAVAGLVERYESLRTTFALIDGELRQRIAPAVAVPITYLDLSGEPSPEERARELARADATAVFDLKTGPLIRIHLLRLGATRHVVLFNMHHIVSDDRSMQVLIRDFVELYGEPREMAARSERSVQYRDYAVWQQGMLRDNEAAIRDRRHWHRQLAGPPVLNLRTDFRRPIEKTYSGASVSCTLGPAATAALKRLCQHHGTTLFMALVAAVKTLLFRYTGQTDIIIGSPVEGRTHRDLEQQVGFFINMLALRDRLDDRMPFVELLHRVRDSVTAALDHQSYPFDALVHDLKLDHDISRSPLFDVVLVLQNPDAQQFTLPDLEISPFGEEVPSSKFDLAFNFEERPDGLALVLVYNPDLFLADTIERMRAHLEALIAGVAIDPGCPLGRVSLLPAAEREQILGYSAPAPWPIGPSSTMVERFEEQVRRAPDAVALTDGARQLTYAALNAMANRCAHYLRSRGVRRNALVGIGMERSIDMIVGLLGIAKAGGAYVPLDLSYPKERLAFIVEDAKLQVVLTDTSHGQLFTSSVATLVDVDADAASISAQSDANPNLPTAPSDLAYVIYTSGSTGRPKGVLVTHANVARLFTATDPWFHFSDRDVWSFFHSHAFDFSVWEIWGALLHGARLVIVPYLTSRSPDAFYDLVRREQVTILSQTPLAFRHFAQAEPAMSGDEDLRLRLVVLGGEALDAPSLRPWFERHPHHPEVINMYGITETTVHVTYRPIGAADTERPASMVGCPIPDLSLYILDAHLQPVPFGVAGELYIGGEGVARGYLNRPELTAERFIPDPFSTQSGARLYKSGDLGCYHANGDVEYLGRADDQVKIRGFRIELGEVASVLSGHENVRECAVIAHAGDDDDKRLIAYLVTATEPAPDAADLRAFLHERLPDYMIPHAFIVLTGMTSLPLTANGKLDRRAVPSPDVRAGLSVASDARPRTELERAIAEVWRDVLKVDAVGIHGNFFDLGGDSIAIIKTRDVLKEQLHIDVPLATLFRFPTISALAGDLSQRTPEDTGTAASAKARAQQQIEGRQRRQRRTPR